MGGTVLAPLSPEMGDNQIGRQESEETGGLGYPVRHRQLRNSAATAYINEVVWKAQDARVVERLESGVGHPPL